MQPLINDPTALRYLDAFRKDFGILNQSSRVAEFCGEKVVIQPGVFPSDSSYSFSTQSILRTVKSDYERNELSEVVSICDMGTGCGVFLCVLGRLFKSARLVGLEIDPAARNNASTNLLNSPNHNYSLLLSDLFSATKEKFDLIVASLPFVCDLRFGNEIDLETLSRFFIKVDRHLTAQGRLYINWASWADFSLFENLADASSLRKLRVDDYPCVVQDFSWRTYVFVR